MSKMMGTHRNATHNLKRKRKLQNIVFFQKRISALSAHVLFKCCISLPLVF
uniref:Uncharacterized protein n=1 Tax=Anguilla anguilla TaxID=7936 RepID=A0A0E9TJ15_ANGAN